MEVKSSLKEVEVILGYEFVNPDLLVEAFTHVSLHGSEHAPSYKRLELVGDSVLNLLITRELFFLYPDLSPGKLTYLRSNNTDNEKLARVAFKRGLHRFLCHNKPLLEHQIQEFEQAIADYPLHSHGLILAPKILADVVEAVIGAVFIDSNSIETVWKVFIGLLELFITLETLGENPVVTLLEICQKHGMHFRYDTDSWEDDKAVKVIIEDRIVGKATNDLKKDVAVNRAARNALVNIHNLFRERERYLLYLVTAIQVCTCEIWLFSLGKERC